MNMNSNFALLITLLLICIISTTLTLKADVPVVAVPLQVTVLLLNFDINKHFSSGEVAALLRGVMPFYSPRDVNDVVFEIEYNVHTDLSLPPSSSALHNKHSNAFINMYDEFIATEKQQQQQGMQNNKGGAKEVEGIISISTKRLSDFITKVVSINDNSKINLKATLLNLPFIIINGNSSAETVTTPRHKYIIDNSNNNDNNYNSNSNSNKCTQHFIGDVLFLDSSAEFCTNNIISGSSDDSIASAVSASDSNNFMKRFTVPYASSPFPLHFPHTNTNTNTTNNKIFDELRKDSLAVRQFFKSQIASVITSGIRQILTGSLRYRASLRKEKIIMPVIVIDNNPISSTAVDDDDSAMKPSATYVDTEQISKYVQRHLLPSQELVVLQSQHNIYEHPQISVVLASSHLQYRSFNSRDNLVDTVPYLSADVFFREINEKISDSLVETLLSKTGHATAYYLNDVLKRNAKEGSVRRKRREAEGRGSERIKGWIKGGVTMSDTSYGDEDSSNANNDVAIVPVFVLSNLYFHNSLHSSNNNNNNNKKNNNSNTESLNPQPAGRVFFNMQPLIDKDSLIGYDKDCSAVMVIHSTNPNPSTNSSSTSSDSSSGYDRVMYYDTHTNTYNPLDSIDVNKLVAEAAVTALSGLSAPHLDLFEGGADYTWSYGNHPFHEYGLVEFPPLSDVDKEGGEGGGKVSAGDGIMTTAAMRTVITSRLHSAMFMAQQVATRAASSVEEVKDALASLQAVSSLNGVGRSSSVGNAGADSELTNLANMYAKFDKLLIDNEKGILKIKKIMDDHSASGSGSSHDVDTTKVIPELVNLEKSVTKNRRNLITNEKMLFDNLRSCKVRYSGHSSGDSKGEKTGGGANEGAGEGQEGQVARVAINSYREGRVAINSPHLGDGHTGRVGQG